MGLRRILSHDTARAVAWCATTPRGLRGASFWSAESSAPRLRASLNAQQRHNRQRRHYSPSPQDFDIMGKGASQVIDTCTSKGFVVGGVEYQGNVFLYQELSLLWGVKTVHDITPDSLLAARAVKPQPDLLIIGCGDRIEQLPKATLEAFQNGETMLEVLDTPNAIATFNILVQEGRLVAAAMILPSS